MCAAGLRGGGLQVGLGRAARRTRGGCLLGRGRLASPAGGGCGALSWKGPRPPEGATRTRPVARGARSALLFTGPRCTLPPGGAGGGDAPAARGPGRRLAQPPPLGHPGRSAGPPALLARAARPAVTHQHRPRGRAPAPYCPPAPSRLPPSLPPSAAAAATEPFASGPPRSSVSRGTSHVRTAAFVAGLTRPPCGAGFSPEWFGGPERPGLPLLEFLPTRCN